jgi:hypothetical protein
MLCGKNKVKVTLVQALRLCTGCTACRGSRGIALPFLDHGTRRGWGVSVTPQPLFTPRQDPVPIVQEAGWAPQPVWTGAENLTSTGIRSPDHPACSQLLYHHATQTTMLCEFYVYSFHSGVAEVSIILRCDAVSLGNWLLTFIRT